MDIIKELTECYSKLCKNNINRKEYPSKPEDILIPSKLTQEKKNNIAKAPLLYKKPPSPLNL